VAQRPFLNWTSAVRGKVIAQTDKKVVPARPVQENIPQFASFQAYVAISSRYIFHIA
jgi:hypothetical protein